MDWAARMVCYGRIIKLVLLELTFIQVEIVSGLPLEDFMRENIWSKLGMCSTTFRPELRPEFVARRVSMAIRNSQDNSLQEGSVPFANPTIDYSGGAGLYQHWRLR
jgi:CubicO group peptidase (beta-lactamase class C family)